MRPVTDIIRKAAPFKVVSDFSPSGDQPHGDRGHRAPARGGRAGCRPARRHRHGQDRDHRLGGRAAPAAGAGDGAQQDTGGAVHQRAEALLPRERGRVLRLLLRLLPARGLRPAVRHLHREGLLDQRGGRAAAALRDQLLVDPARHDRRRLGVLHLRPRFRRRIPRPDGLPARSARRSNATSCCAASSRCSTPATTPRAPAARSGCGATPSRSSRSTRRWPSASSSSATRSSGSPLCIR